MEELNWYKFTENNDNEGETWHFFLQLTDAEQEHIERLIEQGDIDDSYYIDMETFTESEIDVLVKHSDEGYFPTYNKVGRPHKNVLEVDDVDDFYKAQVWFG